MKNRLSLLILPLFLCSCNPHRETIEINQVNWKNYCSFKLYFLGIENYEPKCRAYLYVDTNYEVVKKGYVTAHTEYHLVDTTYGPVDMKVVFTGSYDSPINELSCRPGWTDVHTEWYLDSIDDVEIDFISGTIQKR